MQKKLRNHSRIILFIYLILITNFNKMPQNKKYIFLFPQKANTGFLIIS